MQQKYVAEQRHVGHTNLHSINREENNPNDFDDRNEQNIIGQIDTEVGTPRLWVVMRAGWKEMIGWVMIDEK